MKKPDFQDENETIEQETEIDETEADIDGQKVDLSDFYPDGDESEVDGIEESDTKEFVFDDSAVKAKKKKEGTRLKKGQKIALAIILALYAIVLLVAGYLVFAKPSADVEEIPFDTSEDVDVTDENTTDTTSKTVINNGYKESGKSYNILVVGHDRMAHLADVTMLINCNTKDNTVTVMQIPRDTYVDEEKLTGKINAMFSTYYNSFRYSSSENPTQDTMDAYASMLEKSLCINIHYTVVLDLNGFANIVDALGGVDVYVPSAMYYSDPEQGLYIDIPAGMQHLDGETAEGFVRFRSGYTTADLGRVNAQKIFLTAFFNKAKATVKSVDLAKLNEVAKVIKDNVVTNLEVSDLVTFAKLALKIDLDDITMMTLPGNLGGQYFVMNRAATLAVINQYFNVYNKDISDKIFDRNHLFSSDTYSSISNVYYADAESIWEGAFNAESIDENSISIPRNGY